MSLEEIIEAAVERAVERVLSRKPEPPDLLTYADAARLVGRRPRTIRGWAVSGLLHRVGNGRAVRVRREDVLRVAREVRRMGETPEEVASRLLGDDQ